MLSSAFLDRLRELSQAVVESDPWPAESLQCLAEAGVLGWVIPSEFGGIGVSSAELLTGYRTLAEVDLTTAFILTQRNGACQRIVASGNRLIQEEYLPRLARGDLFATVGISHLSTSRQHWRKPTVKVEQTPEGAFLLEGEIPWVTGAPRADLIVTGGTLPDGRQVLLCLPMDLPGIAVGPPARLLALSGSHTTNVSLKQVLLPPHALLAGPIEQVMRQGQGGTGSPATSALALGLSARSLQALEEEAASRPELQPVVTAFRKEFDRCRSTFEACQREEPGCNADVMRESANSLVLRITQAYLTASKGAGFVAGHPAERAVREALFFLVWSCPRPVMEANLREFACLDG